MASIGSTTQLRVKRGVKGTNCQVFLSDENKRRSSIFESRVFPVLGFKDSSET